MDVRPDPNPPVPPVRHTTQPFTPPPPPPQPAELAAGIAAAEAAAVSPPARVPLPVSALGPVVPYDDQACVLLDKIRVSPAVLGTGKYGIVTDAVVPGIGKLLVAKFIHHDGTQGSCKRIVAEAEFGRRLKHKNIVSYSGSLQTAEGAWLFFSKVEGRTLWSIIDSYHDYKVPEHVMRPLAKQLFHALHYLEKAFILHRDIKGDNIMVSNDGVLKILDFGLASDIRAGLLPIRKRYKHTHPPEYFVEYMGGVGSKADIFMAGLLLFQLCSNSDPFGSLVHEPQEQQVRAVGNGILPAHLNPRVSSLSPRFHALCVKLMRYYPTQRPSAEEALRHPWFDHQMSDYPLPLLSYHHPKELNTANDLDYRAVKSLSTNLTLPVEEINACVLGQPHGWLRVAYNEQVNNFRAQGLPPQLPPGPGSFGRAVAVPTTPAPAAASTADTMAVLADLPAPGPPPTPDRVQVASAGSHARRWFSCVCPGCTS